MNQPHLKCKSARPVNQNGRDHQLQAQRVKPYIAPVADIDECATGTPCINGGTCTNTPAGSFTCDCTGTGYEGDTCQTGKYN